MTCYIFYGATVHELSPLESILYAWLMVSFTSLFSTILIVLIIKNIRGQNIILALKKQYSEI